MNPVHFSSATDEWATPPEFFAKVNAEFGPFDLDPCATAENAKAPRWYTKEDDGIIQPWFGNVWLNPVYGNSEKVCAPEVTGKPCKLKRCAKRGFHRLKPHRGIGEWMKRAYNEVRTTHNLMRKVEAGWLNLAIPEFARQIIALPPARTDTHWWNSYIWDPEAHKPRRGVEVRFIKGRLKFGGAKNSAPFPSALVIFRRQ